MSDLFKWQRKGGSWHLWRGFEVDDGATLWQETGYVVHRTISGREYWIDCPDKAVLGMHRLFSAKAEAERLASL